MPLTKEQALEAYSSKEGASEIAKRLGVDEGTVRKIRLKKTWKAATDEYDAAGGAGGAGDDTGGAIPADGAERQAGGAGKADTAAERDTERGAGVASDVAAQRQGTAGAAGEANGTDHQGHARHVGEGDAVARIAIHLPEPASDDPFKAPNGRRDLFPETVPPKPERKRRVQKEGEPKAPACPKGLEARFVKVLLAAKQYGKVRRLLDPTGKSLTDPESLKAWLIAEGKDGDAVDAEIEAVERINETFMPSRTLSRQLNLGLIKPGEHANTFVLTPEGEARLAEYDAYLSAHNEYLNKLGTWRREVRRKCAAESDLAGEP